MLLAVTLSAPTQSALAAAFAAFVALLAVKGFRAVRGTTLAAPLAWTIASAALLAVVEAFLAARGDDIPASTASLLRYAAAVGAFCPLMAVLGAKRPQDRGWQWIVLSLWIILLVPAGQALASRGGGELQLALIWRLMLGALIALGLLNYLPTRFAFAAALAAVGQIGLLESYFAAPTPDDAVHRLGAIALLAIAAFKVAFTKKGDGSHFTPSDDQFALFTQRWLNFRDAWGAFWALRIMHRVNETAELSHWPIRLQWHGFAPALQLNPTAHAGGYSPPQSEIRDPQSEIPVAHIQQTLDTLLRRFERERPSEIAPMP